MKKILVLGVTGMLGNAVFRYLSDETDFTVFGTLRNQNGISFFPEGMRENLFPQIDLLNPDDTIRVLTKTMPDVIINCVGLIKQLSHSEDPLIALPTNAMLPHRLADLACLMNARVIHISSDCVFSGAKGMYTEEDTCDATDLYGVSKKIGELATYFNAITLRTSMIGHELNSRYALIDWFLSQNESVQGYKSAIFSGLPTVELARVIKDYVIPNPHLSGVYHVAANPVDKYSLLTLTAETYDKKIEIIPDELLKIDRSLNSDRFRQATGYKAPDWPELILRMKNFR
jgi:dTDP-4-dehydrorhamnose reductase